jgi:hypothetical protein
VFNTLYGVIAAVLLVLPGFIVADLAETRRARPPDRSAWELVLRALAYALVLQIAVGLTGWTPQIVEDLESGGSWREHMDAVALYLSAVVLVFPTIVGLALSWFLRRAEIKGRLTTLHYALGGRDARLAWDYIFQRYGSGFVVVTLKENLDTRSSHLVAKFGEGSWATMTPSDCRDVYFEEIWPADATGQITQQFVAPRGMWVSVDQIDNLHFVDPPDPPGPPMPLLGKIAVLVRREAKMESDDSA